MLESRGQRSRRASKLMWSALAVGAVVLVSAAFSVRSSASPALSSGPVRTRSCRAVRVNALGMSRRGLMTGSIALSIPAAASLVSPRNSEAAFKFPGEMPKDLGPRGDGSLKGCPSTSNCWSTSAPDESHKAFPLTFSKGKSEAIADLKEVLTSYPKEGQKINEKDIVDGGGWRLIKNDGGYFQLEYESKKFGFVDDVEFNVLDGKVTYRSASRQGDSDFGVNAYRLNYIAEGLKKKGWETPGFPLTTAAQR